MCIVLFDWQPGSPTPLRLAANRDEFHARPAEPARWRGDIFCGLDLSAGGTWLGIHRDGRMAVVTNFREPIAERQPGERSRGQLPLVFLQGHEGPRDFCLALAEQQHHYGAFNLLVGDRHQLWYLGNRGAAPRAVAPGLHGLCNGLLDDPWPKVERGKQRLRDTLVAPHDLADLLAVVKDPYQPDDAHLPDTGVGLELERLVAPIFIQSPQYGTRASSAVIIGSEGQPRMREQGWSPEGQPLGAPCDSEG